MLFKKTFAIMMTVFFVSLASHSFATDTFIPKGSAVVPGITSAYLSSSSYWYNDIHISNTTSSNIRCKITVYDAEGNNITNAITNGILLMHIEYVPAGATTDTKLTLENGEFDIPALSTRICQIAFGNTIKYITGYAVIEWSSSDSTLRKALIASRHLFKSHNGVTSLGIQEINGGQIF